MACSINIRSDNESADAIRSLWTECSILEDVPSMSALDYPPHITLAVYDSIDRRALLNAYSSVFANASQIPVRFERLGHFVAPHAIILWAAPALPRSVWSMHARIHQLLDAELCRPSYRPETWAPHCSLATAVDLSRKAEAIDIATRPIEPFEVVFDVADCASFAPVKVIEQRKLPAEPESGFADTMDDE